VNPREELSPKPEARNGGNGGWRFLDRHLGTIIMLGLLLIGQFTTFAILQTRVSELEDQTKNMVPLNEHRDLQRRMEALESEIVPRAEHQARDQELDDRLRNIESEQKHLHEMLDEVILELRLHPPKEHA
jgi:hypothetical protein